LKGGAGADGLFQRFQLLVYPDDPGPWENIDRWPNTEAKNKAFAVFDQLAGRGFEGFVASSGAVSRDESSSGSIPFLRFSEPAQVVFDDWRAELERKIRAGDEHPAVEAHLSKYRSLMPSLALVFHVISTIDTGKASPVSEAAAKMAAAWCDYLEDHARRIYHGLIQRDVSTAHRLARKILAGKLVNPFTAREAYRKDWTGLSDGEVIEAGAALLDELGWIKTDRVTAGASGGRPTARYWINPKIARKVD
jgi:putative DNA primase/helicase